MLLVAVAEAGRRCPRRFQLAAPADVGAVAAPDDLGGLDQILIEAGGSQVAPELPPGAGIGQVAVAARLRDEGPGALAPTAEIIFARQDVFAKRHVC